MKPPRLLLCLLLAAALPACVTRYSAPSRALGRPVSVLAEYDAADRVLRTETSAGAFEIGSVRLVDARGRVLAPAAAYREGPELVGGSTLSTGIGHGGYGLGGGRGGRGHGLGGGIGVGVGVTRPRGGRLVPGDHVARFLDPPVAAQPWTLRVRTAGTPAVTVDVLLAGLENRDEVEAGGAELELSLPTGGTRRFVEARGDDGGTRYEAAGDAGS